MPSTASATWSEFFFSEHRDLPAAKRFFRKALDRHGRPDRIVIDGSPTNHEAIISCDAEHRLRNRSRRALKPIRIRKSKYLNNRIEQFAPRKMASAWGAQLRMTLAALPAHSGNEVRAAFLRLSTVRHSRTTVLIAASSWWTARASWFNDRRTSSGPKPNSRCRDRRLSASVKFFDVLGFEVADHLLDNGLMMPRRRGQATRNGC
ncbi:hypothetical protein BQ8794_240078 [Mesorhizobium prunaredense]|uniref:DDE domain-containing protein n=1 Tax=Mesorhizobium prunaredense TaxID=1631249 RepID=A0A1R3V7S0_9HYPH|nr:hypothetical protein BQ8794_240078 [Mesorhizobium prunaredense]